MTSKKSKVFDVGKIISNMRVVMESMDRTYIVGNLQSYASRKAAGSPISTNGPVEFTQASWRDSDGNIQPGVKAASLAKGLVGIVHSPDSETMRFEAIMDILISRIFPSGVVQQCLLYAGKVPSQVLKDACIKRLGEVPGKKFHAFVRAGVAFIASVSETTEAPAGKSGKSFVSLGNLEAYKTPTKVKKAKKVKKVKKAKVTAVRSGPPTKESKANALELMEEMAKGSN